MVVKKIEFSRPIFLGLNILLVGGIFVILATSIPDGQILTGFSIDIFGKNSVVINGIPSGLDDINEKEIVDPDIGL